MTKTGETGSWGAIAGFGAAAAILRLAVTDGGGWLPLLAVNLAGCALLGVLLARGRATPGLALGFCGSLTTFSGIATLAAAGGRGEAIPLAAGAGGELPAGVAGLVLVVTMNVLGGASAFVLARRAAGQAVGAPQ